ncbi:MAG: hypothetical protein S4CHLAM45_11290 [Chlamydiales bacterium]|nr:hypothetical protein [Chlamydiales bacterium]MCH9619621.1 hypothetical protein [Chlamydiales bacterium]MCH9623227.1 hypothetical protein [Chlamydiales bacterium]
MNPLFFTFTFLTLLGILTSSEVMNYTQMAHSRHIYENHLVTAEKKEFAIQSAYFQDFQEERSDNPKSHPSPKEVEENQPPSRKPLVASLDFDRMRPPNNSRLNLYEMIHCNKREVYVITARLIRSLYGESEFFQAIPDAEIKILDLLLEKKEETSSFTTPDELATLDFNNPMLQTIFIRMLKETPSLLNYLTFDKNSYYLRRRINLMFADEKVIHAAIPSEKLSSQVLAIRDRAWEEIEYQEAHRKQLSSGKGRTEFKEELTAAFNSVVHEEELRKLFDLSLEKSGTVIFLKSPITNNIIREKYIKRAR